MCDTLCVRTNEATLFAKNSDRHPDEAQVVEWHDRRAGGAELRTQYLTVADPGAYAFLGSRPTWLWGVEHGVNEHGVAIGNEKVWTVDRPRDLPPALLGMDLVRLGLERAASAEEALTVLTTLLERHGQGGSGEPHRDEPYFSSFLVADPDAGFVLETSNRTWAARPVGAGAAISNRITLTTDWTRASSNLADDTDFDTYRWPRMPTAIADHRLSHTRAAVARGTATTARDLAGALRDHGRGRNAEELPLDVGADGAGFSVCMHRRESHSQTTASMIAELRTAAPARAWVSLGNPCSSVYVPCFPPAVAPELAEAEQWRRFARLRDRVEASPERLADVRVVLTAVEAELWTQAEAVFVSGERSRLDAFAYAAFSPVDAALRRLGV
ncbi:MAG TPA: peptidase family C69 [Acidimicrobiia bacterium]